MKDAKGHGSAGRGAAKAERRTAAFGVEWLTSEEVARHLAHKMLTEKIVGATDGKTGANPAHSSQIEKKVQ